jgi:hypothetical protein
MFTLLLLYIISGKCAIIIVSTTNNSKKALLPLIFSNEFCIFAHSYYSLFYSAGEIKLIRTNMQKTHHRNYH